MESNRVVIDAGTLDREAILKGVKYKVIGCASAINDENKVPFRHLCDIRFAYAVEMASGEDYVASLVVTNEALRKNNITITELDNAAMENTKKSRFVVKTMAEMMEGLGVDLFGTPDWSPMLIVVTGENNVGGPNAMLVPDVMDEVSKKIGGDFYILPSSVYEILAVSPNGMEIGDLCKTVASVNDSMVAPEDRLSYTVYRYDGVSKTIAIA